MSPVGQTDAQIYQDAVNRYWSRTNKDEVMMMGGHRGAVMMPGMAGFEVCRRLKSDPAMSFIPIILVTARAASQDVVTGLDAGVGPSG